MNFSGSSPHSLYTSWREIQNPTTIMRTAIESVNTQVIVWTTGFTHTCYERSSRNVVCCCMPWGAIGLKTDHAPLCLSLLLILLAWLDVNVHDGDGDMITDWSQEVSHSVCLFYSNPLQANTTDCCIEYLYNLVEAENYYICMYMDGKLKYALVVCPCIKKKGTFTLRVIKKIIFVDRCHAYGSLRT